jgi:electron transfer flavoprotein alpha subunit
MTQTAGIYSNDPKLAYELIAKSKELGFRAVVWALGEKVENPEQYLHRGADAVHYVESPALAHHPVDVVAQVLAAAVPAAGAQCVFIGGNRHGKELAPYLAAKLDAGMVSFAIAARKGGDGKLEFDRMFMGGKTIATEVPQSPVVVATFATRLFEPLPADPARKGEGVTKHAMDLAPSKVKVAAVKQRQAAGVNLEEAPIVVGAGRGFKSKDDLKLAFELAQTLGGQVGCSRPLATDLGWLTDEYWIGLSGKEVKPKLYVAAGISGQIQHTTGIRGSKVIVAINTNKDAPIFKQADYGIVGDLYKVLPALNAAIKKELGK